MLMSPVTEIPKPDIKAIADSAKTHWVNRAPMGIRPYLQLSRLDRPVGYWLLALPGWIGLTFAGLSHGLVWTDLIWAVLILIGSIAMRGAGCTYNDIVDQDLDAQVERTALRPLPAGTVTTRQAWTWTFAQIGVGFLVWLCLPMLAKGIALLALPLVAAYPFMKRITWFPQVWLGMTFNWAVLVAYTAKTGTVSTPLFILYAGLIFWTVGYDTIYACQDIEDDAMVGIKSTARKFGSKLKLGISIAFALTIFFTTIAILAEIWNQNSGAIIFFWSFFLFTPLGFAAHLMSQVSKLKTNIDQNALSLFKSNIWAAALLILGLIIADLTLHEDLTNIVKAVNGNP